jgi:arginine deiminase
MNDEERQRQMDFIVEHLARLAVHHDKFAEDLESSNYRIARMERLLKLVISAGRRARREMREAHDDFNERFAKVTDALTSLAAIQTRTEESIAHTDKRLDALIDIVRQQQNGAR